MVYLALLIDQLNTTNANFFVFTPLHISQRYGYRICLQECVWVKKKYIGRFPGFCSEVTGSTEAKVLARTNNVHIRQGFNRIS
ncbi:hypothetical protein ADS46_10880 [Halomonas sp. G11]|nr:hypothetical protein ADS46_10880 [Halomonas sp. G11]